jgi:hypothetical protein
MAESGQLWTDVSVSLKRAATGFAFALVIGLALGLAAGLSRVGERLLDSTMQVLRMIPFIALVPLLIVWFGLGEKPRLVLIGAACTFPIYLNTYAGVRNTDPKLIEAGTVFVLDRRPDFGALPGLRGVFRSFLAFEGERLAGTVTALCRKAIERDRVVLVGEVIDFRVAAWARGGRAAFLLLRAAYEAFCVYGVDWIACLIGDRNRATLLALARDDKGD